jgi:hypothetical protein
MTFWRTVLAAFVGAVLAIVFVLAWLSSKETGKSIPGSIPDVPGEAQRLAGSVRSRTTEAASAGWGTVLKKETALKERIFGDGDGDEASEQSAEAVAGREEGFVQSGEVAPEA